MAQIGSYERLDGSTETVDEEHHHHTVQFRGVNTSWVFFLFYTVLIVCMILACLFVVATQGWAPVCDQPLLLWSLVHVARHVVKACLFSLKYCFREQDNRWLNRSILVLIKCTEIFSLAWWFQGASWLYYLQSCQTDVYWLMIVFFGVQCTFLLIPCILGILCLPFIFWVLPYLVPPNPNQLATSEAMIERLQKYAWNSATHWRNLGLENPMRMIDPDPDPRCAICLSELEEGQEVIEMPCDKTHVFHGDCVVGWLRTSQNCPLCRSNVPQKIDAEDVPSADDSSV